MAIKSKKWKNSVGFVSFFVGVSLLLSGGSYIADCVSSSGDLKAVAELYTESDYQKTTSFRQFVSGRLETFIVMATGGYVYSDGYYYSEGSDWEYSGNTAESKAEYGTAQETTIEDSAEENPMVGYSVDGYMRSNVVSGTGYTKQEKKASAEYYHKSIQKDKNVLYRVSYDGKELYSNMEDTVWDEKQNKLPDGYNFSLHFDGTNVSIYKDGKEVDVYGDGRYRDGDWYVPGYSNFKNLKEWQKADIVLLVAKEPVCYVGNGYGDSSWDTGITNELYYIRQELLQQRANLVHAILAVILGMLLFFVYLWQRKSKQQTDVWLAKLTGKVWFEVKLLILLLLPAGMLFSCYDSLEVTETAGYVTEMYYAYDAKIGIGFFTELGRYLLSERLGGAAILLALFWVCYLFLNDLIKNKKSYANGLTAKILHVCKSRDLKLPLSKRVVKGFRAIYGWTIFGFAGMFILFLYVVLFVNYPDFFEVMLPLLLCLVLFITVVMGYFYQQRNRRMAEEMQSLAKKIDSIHEGNYDGKEPVAAKDSDIRKMAEQLEDIRYGMEHAVEERMKSEHMKVELVANVSHDIKTPLTSIISYIELLKQEEDLPDYIKDYVHILDEKAERLKTMVQDVFSVSKAASGQLSVTLEKLDFGKLLRQTLADMDEQVKSSPITMRLDIPEEPVVVMADGQRMYRVIQNIVHNALKYSLEGSRIYVTLKEDGEAAVCSIKNTSEYELSGNVDFTERFTRGDESRTDGGTGLGLSIAKSFTEACGGTFRVETIADLFVVTVTFTLEQ